MTYLFICNSKQENFYCFVETLILTKFDPSGPGQVPNKQNTGFYEISIVKNWLIIHVIKSLPLLVLCSYCIATFHDLEDSSSVRHG